MKKLIGTAVAAVLVTGSVGGSFAAAPAAPTPTPAAPPAAAAPAAPALTMLISEAITLKAWIVDQKKASVAAPAGFTVAVGATVPTGVMLYPIPAGVAATGMNQYTVIADKIVLVSPTDRKIVYVYA